MFVTLAGMVMLVSATDSEKAYSPMLASWLPDSIVTVARNNVPANACSPMLVTLAGMVISVSNCASPNAESPMLVTPSGISATPAHEPPEVTTLFVIVNVPEVPQSTGPSAAACAGLRTSPDMTKTRVVNKVTTLLYLPSDFAVLANKAVPPRDSCLNTKIHLVNNKLRINSTEVTEYYRMLSKVWGYP